MLKRVVGCLIIAIFLQQQTAANLFDDVQDELMMMEDDYFEFKARRRGEASMFSSYPVFKHAIETYSISKMVNIINGRPVNCKNFHFDYEEDSVVDDFLCNYNSKIHDFRKIRGNMQFMNDINMTKHNAARLSEFAAAMTKWNLQQLKEGKNLLKEQHLSSYQRRLLKELTRSAEPKSSYLRRLRRSLKTKIETVYSKAKICKPWKPDECYQYEPGIINIMATSKNYSELEWAWKAWRDAIGPKTRQNWTTIVNIDNIGAWQNGYSDTGAYWRSVYEDSSFETEVHNLWMELKPHYQQLHAYVRRKLHDTYGDVIGLHDPIPAHVLGNLWGMKWDHIINLVKPYPSIDKFDVKAGMKAKNITTMKMFHLADEFYQSMGLPAMPQSFWERSMFKRPKDHRSVVCYASAFNLEDTDVRVKMCAEPNAEYLYVVHHEMGHCQYYLAYNKKQPEIFQKGANNGFHEAIGDTASLSVISIPHLQKIGVLKKETVDAEQNKKIQINMLMTKALGKLAFFPYALTMALYRWRVFRGQIKEDELNSGWWKLRKEFQGLRPPVARSEKDFDPGCKYHITYMVPYVRYFISHVLEFQFYERLCNLAGHKSSLHLCDFAGSKEAGKEFEKMLQKGDSQHWKLTLQEFLGSPNGKISVSSVVNYFKPLIEWLKKENKRLGNKVGWE